MVHLNNIWFVIIAIFWVGFFILEGFDFGVGMLHSFVGRNDVERRIAVNSIGPVWDGNEVWLVVAAAAIFAAFPSWYATMFSTLYLVMVIVLLALIGRGVSFEFTRKIDNPRWRATWRWSLTVGSALIPFLLGTALGDLLHGLPIDSSHNYTGSFWGLLVPFGLYTGLTVTVLGLFVGAAYLTLKTEGALHDRVARLSGRLGWLAAVDHLRLADVAPCRAGFGLRSQADRGAGAGRGGRWRLAGRIPLRRLGLRRRRHSHRERRGVDLLRALPAGDGVQHELGVQPDGGQLGQQFVLPQGDDRGGGHLLPVRPPLPGMEPLHLPQTHQRRASI